MLRLPPGEHVEKNVRNSVPRSFFSSLLESKSPVGESIVVLTVTIARPEEFVHVPRGTDLPYISIFYFSKQLRPEKAPLIAVQYLSVYRGPNRG